MYAATNGRVENMRLLAAAGADVNASADRGQTALSIAKARNHLDAVEVLRSLGAKDDPAQDAF